MKNTLIFTVFTALIFGMLSSCTPKNNTETSEVKSQEKEKIYSINTDSIALQWTAYKTTQRIGVNGSFDSISINSEKTSGTIIELLANTKINISTASVNSNNEIRDPKIVAFLFGKFSVPNEILATVDSANAEKAYISITMNGVTKPVEANYTVKDNVLEIIANVNTPDWNAEAGLAALNNECEDLHKGEDGISKLWPEVSIAINCQLELVE
jgi:hypothetical protein